MVLKENTRRQKKKIHTKIVFELQKNENSPFFFQSILVDK